MLITILYSLIVKKLRKQTVYGVRNLVVHFSSREKRNRNVLKMSLLAIIVVFFLSMSPFVVSLSDSLFSPEGKFCPSKDFRIVPQFLVHENSGIINFFYVFHI